MSPEPNKGPGKLANAVASTFAVVIVALLLLAFAKWIGV